MKVFVIGLDCLEYEDVLSWKLDNLMQRYYGRYDVKPAVKEGNPLYTPLIWASFLTGNPSYRYGFSSESLGRRTWGKFYLLYKIRRMIPIRNLHLRRVAINLRIKNLDCGMERMPEEARRDTFLQIAESKGYRVWAKEIPSYNDDLIARYRMSIGLVYNRPLEEKLEALGRVFSDVERLWREALLALPDHDLVMFYSPLPDFAHHMFPTKKMKHRLRMYDVYKRLNEMVSSAPDDAAKLIVSDHGFDSGKFTHSDYGFWSSNVPLPREPKTVLDFKSIVLDLLEE